MKYDGLDSRERISRATLAIRRCRCANPRTAVSTGVTVNPPPDNAAVVAVVKPCRSTRSRGGRQLLRLFVATEEIGDCFGWRIREVADHGFGAGGQGSTPPLPSLPPFPSSLPSLPLPHPSPVPSLPFFPRGTGYPPPESGGSSPEKLKFYIAVGEFLRMLAC